MKLPVALRAVLRYAVPLLLLSTLALGPLAVLELRITAPADLAAAKDQLRMIWILLPLAWLGQLALVGAATPMIASLAGTPLTQWRALRAGFAGLAGAIVPTLVGFAAIMISTFALVVPGLAVIVLFSLTAASTARGAALPLAFAGSVATVRRNLAIVVATVVIALIADIAITYVARTLVAPLANPKPTPHDLATFVGFVRVALLGLVVVSPIVACSLAAIDARDRS